jgi:hypothetical protein
MKWEGLSALIVAGVAASKLVLDARGRNNRRERIGRDLEIIERLPAESGARGRLMEHVERSIDQLIAEEAMKRRDWTGVALAVVLLAAGAWMAVMAGRGTDLWWIGAIATGVVGAVGLGQDLPKRMRDERGRPISG